MSATLYLRAQHVGNALFGLQGMSSDRQEVLDQVRVPTWLASHPHLLLPPLLLNLLEFPDTTNGESTKKMLVGLLRYTYSTCYFNPKLDGCRTAERHKLWHTPLFS